MIIKHFQTSYMIGMALYMSNRILFCTGEGVGNLIQTIPVLRTLREVLNYRVDMWHAFGSYNIPKNLLPYVDKCYLGGKIKSLDRKNYRGFVSTAFTRSHSKILTESGLILLARIVPLSPSRSEVDTYMDIARDLGVKEKNIIWEGVCNYKSVKASYDIVMHDGYNRRSGVSDTWHLKSYPYYKKVAKILLDKGYNVASVGSKGEYIKGTVNQIGLNLLSTLGIIKNSKLFLGNDSGLYHCANAVGTDNIVIFTFTSTMKNYDKRFHKYSTILRNEELSCLDCQNTKRFIPCKTHECREIDPEIVVNSIVEKLS